MTKTITITDIADLRAGDVATCSYRGHEFTGEVWASFRGDLFVGETFVYSFDGHPSPTISLVSATRALPDLPIELGSVIANVVTKDGDRYDRAMLAKPGVCPWAATNEDGWDWLRMDEIVSWDACTVEVQS